MWFAISRVGQEAHETELASYAPAFSMQIVAGALSGGPPTSPLAVGSSASPGQASLVIDAEFLFGEQACDVEALEEDPENWTVNSPVSSPS